MPPVTLVNPQDLVKKTSSQALFPVLESGVPQSETKVLVGYKKLLHGYKVKPSEDAAIVYKPQDCVFKGLLREASSLPQNTLQIHEPGNTFFYNGDQNLLALSLSQNTVAQSFNTYYLHWGFDRMHCVQLKSHANYFITAALQGCSIYVTGDPMMPTVFHLNANSVTGVGGTAAAAQQAKLKAMDSRFTSATQALGISKKGYGVATMEQYMPGMLSQAGTTQLEQEYGVDGLQWYHFKAKTFRSFWKVDQDALLQYGTVFGVREGGKWAFYFQKRTRHEYEYKSWMSGRTTYAEWSVSCSKFWPTA